MSDRQTITTKIVNRQVTIIVGGITTQTSHADKLPEDAVVSADVEMPEEAHAPKQTKFRTMVVIFNQKMTNLTS